MYYLKLSTDVKDNQITLTVALKIDVSIFKQKIYFVLHFQVHCRTNMFHLFKTSHVSFLPLLLLSLSEQYCGVMTLGS